jgi:hypothetical protein
VDLPWWAVPPSGGSVVLRTTRTRVTETSDHRHVRASSTLELEIPLDSPPAASDETRPLPTRPAVPRGGPRRIGRPVRNPVG